MAELAPPRSGSLVRTKTVVGAVLVAAATALIAQALLRTLFMDLEIMDGRVISAIFHVIVVAAPVVFFLAWRISVEREARVEAMLRNSEALREDLTSMLVHDLKNPIVSAGLALGALSSRESVRSAITDEDQELMGIAKESLTRLEKMVGDILDIARTEAGTMPLDPEVADLGELVREATRQSALLYSDARLELAIDLPENSLMARIDVGRVRRVIDNLQANAIKYTPAGGRVTIRAASEGGECMVTVADTGPGIPRAVQGHLFDKFGRAGADSKGQRMSAGLGLYYCRLVVLAHGGRIWVDSEETGGSTFGFTVPLAHEED
jgi:signal transduction histidine kinase